MTVVNILCPWCNEWKKATSPLIEIGHGAVNWTCPDCKTHFSVQIEFLEVPDVEYIVK